MSDHATELFRMIAGQELGSGCYRTVYAYRPDPALVLKVATEGPEANVIEHALWREIEHEKEFARWFAPVIDMSECGTYLLQRRVEFGRKTDYPKQIPAWFTDLKCENFGWIGNQFVCCDYGSFYLSRQLTRRMKPVAWT